MASQPPHHYHYDSYDSSSTGYDDNAHDNDDNGSDESEVISDTSSSSTSWLSSPSSSSARSCIASIIVQQQQHEKELRHPLTTTMDECTDYSESFRNEHLDPLHETPDDPQIYVLLGTGSSSSTHAASSSSRRRRGKRTRQSSVSFVLWQWLPSWWIVMGGEPTRHDTISNSTAQYDAQLWEDRVQAVCQRKSVKQQLAQRHKQRTRKQQQRRRRWLAGGAVGFMLLLLVGAVLVWQLSKSGSSGEEIIRHGVGDDCPGSRNPSSSWRWDEVSRRLSNSTLQEILTKGTPQQAAWEWLQQNDTYYPDDDDVLSVLMQPDTNSSAAYCTLQANHQIQRALQRFALATLYYAVQPTATSRNNHNNHSSSYAAATEEALLPTVLSRQTSECQWFAGGVPRTDDAVVADHQTSSHYEPCNRYHQLQSLSLHPSSDVHQSSTTSRTGSGRLPPELGYLSTLKHVDLANSQLVGPFPTPVLGQWKNLETLTVEHNRLSGPLPTELGLLTASNGLTSLVFSGNTFTGFIPSELGLLTHVTKLELHQNPLLERQTLPAEICALSQPQPGRRRTTNVTVDCHIVTCPCDCHCAASVAQDDASVDSFSDADGAAKDVGTTRVRTKPRHSNIFLGNHNIGNNQDSNIFAKDKPHDEGASVPDKDGTAHYADYARTTSKPHHSNIFLGNHIGNNQDSNIFARDGHNGGGGSLPNTDSAAHYADYAGTTAKPHHSNIFLGNHIRNKQDSNIFARDAHDGGDVKEANTPSPSTLPSNSPSKSPSQSPSMSANPSGGPSAVPSSSPSRCSTSAGSGGSYRETSGDPRAITNPSARFS